MLSSLVNKRLIKKWDKTLIKQDFYNVFNHVFYNAILIIISVLFVFNTALFEYRKALH
jgi:hypothetical protein